MHDALDESPVARIPVDDAFRQRFGNPYAVIHRADVHRALLERAEASGRVEVLTSTRVASIEDVVVTFHSRQKEEWSVTEGSAAEVLTYFEGTCPRARQLIELPKSWKRWATADRDPIGQWTFGVATLCSATPPTRACSTWRRAPAWRSKTR